MLVNASSTFVAANGDGYEAQMGRWSRRLAPLIIGFAEISAAEHVLDVGCGTGSLTFELARNPRIRSVEGIDLSPTYVGYASERSRDSRVCFKVGDACALPFPDGSFDHSLSSLVLQFIPDARRAVREMKRVTRCGGTVIAATWDTENQVINRMFFETAGEFDAKARELRAAACARPVARPDGLIDVWRDAGLADVALNSLTISMDFASFADFWTPFEGKDGPYAQYFGTLPEHHKARLRNRLEAVYLNDDLDGPRSYPARAWAVKGRVLE
jgi:SAM-dependent methyltransferase